MKRTKSEMTALAAFTGIAEPMPRVRSTLSEMVRDLPAAIWAKDALGRYLFHNPAFLKLFELPETTVLTGRTDDDFCSPADAQAFRAKDREIIARGLIEQFYEPVHLADSVKHVLTMKFPLRDPAGVPYAACGICFDITGTLRHRDEPGRQEAELLKLSRSAAIDTGELPQSLPLIASAALAGLGIARASIWLWDDSRKLLSCACLVDRRGAQYQPEQRSQRRESFPRYFAALDAEHTIIAHKADTDPRTRELNEGYFDVHGISSVLDVAIRVGGETVGVLCCEHIGPARIWMEPEADFASGLASMAGRALVAARRREADGALLRLNQELEARVAERTLEARRAESEARIAKDQLIALTDQMPGGVAQLLWRGPNQLELLYLSGGIERMAGMVDGPASLDVTLALAAVEPEDRQGLIDAINQAATTPDQPLDKVIRCRHLGNGQRYWVQLQARVEPLEDGSVLFNAGFADITGRKKLEDAMAESERLLKAAVSASGDGVWEWNLATDVVYFSPRWFEMLGYPDAAMPFSLETFTALCHPDDQQATFEQVARTVEAEGERPYAAEFRMCCADGSWRWVLGRGSVSERDAKGRALRLTGTNTDIDFHKRREASLSAATAFAQSASKAKSDFLSNMSHELRTPMNAIIGLAQILADSPLEERQRGLLGKLQTASRTLLALVNDVLDLSKIEAGRLGLEQLPFRLGETLDLVQSIAGTAAEAKGLKLDLHCPPEVPQILRGDALRLSQVLLNLAGNAIKFTEQGRVTLEVTPLAVDATRAHLRFSVQDSGIGIPADTLARLFVPFEQGSPGISRRYGGSGLGLTISQRLVQLMGGELKAESEPERGSRFWFEATFERAEAVPIAPPPTPDESLQGLKVLAAEDNEINLEILVELLHRAGAEVRTARDGAEAVAVCAEGWPELVLMDMQMPDIDGIAATRLLRADARFATLPIIALTANALSEDRERCLEAGMNDHLTKPIEVDELYATLHRWRPSASH